MRMKQEKQINLMNRFTRIGFALVLTMLAGFLAPGGPVGPSVAQADTLSVTGNTPIASGSKTDTAAYVIMQRFQVNSTGLDDGVVLNSMTLDGSAATATAYSAARIYISLSSAATSTLPAGAVQIGKSTTYTGASQAIPLNFGTVTDRTVTNAAPKFIYIVYDMKPGQAPNTALSRVTAVGVAAPDNGVTGLTTYLSNTITLAAGVNALISACNGCHGVSGNFIDGTSRNVPEGLFPGSHTKHAGGAPLSLTCDKCHVNPLEINHLNGLINMANQIYNALGSYSKSGATYSFAQSNVPNPTMGTCGTVYCHGAGTPLWGGTLSDVAECDSCHGGNAASTATAGLGQITLGNHPDHMNNVAVLGTNYECVVCHSTTVSAGNDRAVTGSVHVDGTKNVSMPLGGSWTSGTETCSNVYCHSSGKGTYAAVPVWGSATDLTCNGCHGTGNAYGSPDYANAASPNQNSHTKHTTAGAASCDACHTSTVTTAGTAIKAASILHTNNALDVTFNTAKAGASAAWVAGTKTCSTTYCHGTAGVVWGAAATCSSCHSSQGAGTGAAAYIAKHQKHTDAATYKLACDNCHDPDQASHAGGLADAAAPQQAAQILFENSGTVGTWLTKQYGGGGTTFNYTRINQSPYGLAAPAPAYTKGVTAGAADNGFPWTTNGSCNSVWCHSNANPRTRTVGETAGALNAYRTVAFNATTACTTCHLGPAAVATMTAATDRLSTNHADHIATDRYGLNTTNYTCNTCHTNSASNNTTISSFVTHANATKEVVINTAFWGGGTWSSSAASCSTVYCHSTGDRLGFGSPVYTTPTWTGAAISTCNACHRASGDNYATMTGATTDRLSPAHAEHIASDRHGLNASYTCNTCHNGVADSNTVINTTTGYGLHVNKAKNVVINAFGGSGTWNTPANTCSTTYCHSKGTGGTTETGEVRAISASTSSAWTDTITACNVCHGTESGTNGAPAYANLRKSPTAAPATTGWTTPTNVYASDDARAVFSGTGQNYLYITGFGFTITDVPDGSTIRDITVIIEGNGTSATAVERQLRVALTKTGAAVVGTAKSDATTQLYLTSDRELVLGGNNDLWGITWTPAEIRATTFGVAISDSNTTANALNIDRVRVVVHTDAAPKKNSHPNHMAVAGVTCGSCHSNTVANNTNNPITTTGYANHVNKLYSVTGTSITAYTYNVAGGTCTTSCHGGLSGTAASGVPQWGVSEMDCVGCHITAQGTRSAITNSEFGVTYGHKKTGRGAVTNADCIVCHLEGNFTTQKTSALHANGNIDLRDPDGVGEVAITNMTGGAYTFTKFATSYAALSRSSAGTTLNTVDNVLTQKFCLACHDLGGATNTTARAGTGPTATAPFGGGFTALDTKTQFALTNSSRHPVLGPLNKDYPTATRLADPYKPTGTRGTSGTKSQGVVINCFDCHNAPTVLTTRTVAAHGNNTDWLRGTINVASPTLCATCHLGYTGNSANTDIGHNNAATGFTSGSAFGGAGNDRMNTEQDTCNYCHADVLAPARPTGAANVHGTNVLPTGGATKTLRWLAGGATGVPVSFIRNTTYLTNHQPKNVAGTVYSPQCSMTNCTARVGSPYSLGGTY